jgi:predicted DNA-binding transcriptional regulator AlpA
MSGEDKRQQRDGLGNRHTRKDILPIVIFSWVARFCKAMASIVVGIGADDRSRCLLLGMVVNTRNPECSNDGKTAPLILWPELLEMLGASRRTILRWVHADKFPKPIDLPGEWRWERAAVMRFLEGRPAKTIGAPVKECEPA